MSQKKQVGMSMVRKKKRFCENNSGSFWCSFPACTLCHSRVSAGTVLPKEKIRMVFLAISVIFVHKGQSLKPEALFWEFLLDRGPEIASSWLFRKVQKRSSRKEVKNQRKYFYKTDCAGRKLLHPYRQCTCLYTGTIQHWKNPKRMDRNRGTEGTNTQETFWRRELFNRRAAKIFMHLGVASIPSFVKTTNRH